MMWNYVASMLSALAEEADQMPQHPVATVLNSDAAAKYANRLGIQTRLSRARAYLPD